MTKKIENTGERMIPEYHDASLMYAEHITRYEAALQLVKGKTVLDIASGSGYGTRILSKTAKFVHGIDVSDEAVKYAKKNFVEKNIKFTQGSGEAIPLENASVDVAITFETIEHIKNYKKFIVELKRVLKPDGLLVVSTPNDLEFAEGNHYHLHEFREAELVKLVQTQFKNVDRYYQADMKAVLIGDKKAIESEDVPAVFRNFSRIVPKQYLYFYFLCSNRDIVEKVNPIIASGEHYSERAFQESLTAKQGYLTDIHERNLEIARLNKIVTEKQKEINQLMRHPVVRVTRKIRSIRQEKQEK